MTFKEVRRRLRDEGWVRRRQSGSHEQWYHQATGRGPVTVAGDDADTVPPKTLSSIRRQAGWTAAGPAPDRMQRLVIAAEPGGPTPIMHLERRIAVTVVLEAARQDGEILNYAAYAPDWPGCAATGRTPEETLDRMYTVLAWHIGALTGQAVEPRDLAVTIRDDTAAPSS